MFQSELILIKPLQILLGTARLSSCRYVLFLSLTVSDIHPHYSYKVEINKRFACDKYNDPFEKTRLWLLQLDLEANIKVVISLFQRGSR